MSGQPSFILEFIQKSVTAIKRSAQGVLCIILNDDVMDSDVKIFNNLTDVKSTDFSLHSQELLQLAFMGKPFKVIVVKNQAEIGDTVKLLEKNKYNYLIMPEAKQSDITALQSYVSSVRAKRNGFMRCVFANAIAPDDFSIINFCAENIIANITGEAKSYTAGDYTCRIAGILSGLPDTRSATYFDLPELVDIDLQEDPDLSADEGKLVILFDDGKFKLGRAVNSLTTLTSLVGTAFQKIRITSTMDLIAEDIITTFRNSYVGKYVNDYANKVRFVGAINSYLKALTPVLLDENMTNKVAVSYEKNKQYLESQGIDTSAFDFNTILQYNTGSMVLLDGAVAPTDVMEDLDLSINLFGVIE